jgi:MFS family permease
MEKKSNFGKFLILWSGELISAIGGGLTSFGLSVYVYQKTGSAGSMALVSLFAFLPMLLLSPIAGVFADRFDRRLLMMIGDGLSAIGLIYILICMFSGEAKVYQICIGVFINSFFSALLEPSYRATITDLLTKDEYSKASGMVSIAGSSRYLISPLIAGLLLAISDVKLLICIDIFTFVLTVICTAIVRKGIEQKKAENSDSFIKSFKEGWKAITVKKGIFILIMISAVMTCFMGVIQILVEPIILDFQSSKVLGIAETLCASGMLVSSVIIGIAGLKKHFVRILSISLAICGLSMIGMGFKENIIIICCFGFMFFFALPFANNCLDYLTRTNIDADKQGRAWGLISFLSQIGYVVAYGCAGMLSDKIAAVRNISIGRGAAGVVMISGALLTITALSILGFKEVKKLEKGDSDD